MAQRWFHKASVQSALVSTIIGTLPAAAIAIAAIYYQKDLADKQLKQQVRADSSQSISDSIEFSNRLKQHTADSLLTLRQIALSELQYTLESKKMESELQLAKSMETINKQSLAVTKAQFQLNKQGENIKRANNIIQFSQALRGIQNILFLDFINSNTDKEESLAKWHNDLITQVDVMTKNPILLEDLTLHEDWRQALDNSRVFHNAFEMMGSIAHGSLIQTERNPAQEIKSEETRIYKKLLDRSIEFYDRLNLKHVNN